MDMALETKVFLISMLGTGILLFKKMKKMIITWNTDPMGFRWPDSLSRLSEFLFFALPVAIILVWGALEINIHFDSSEPQIIAGTVDGKIRNDTIGNLYKLKVMPELAEIRINTKLRVDYDLYKNIEIGSKVNLTIKQGALGYPYIEHVSLITQHENGTKNL